MKTTVLGAEIVKEAMRWRDGNCFERDKKGKKADTNKVYCDFERPKWKNGKPDGTAWCGTFAFEMVETACQIVGVKNLLSKSNSADASKIVKTSDKSVRNYDVPAVGAVFNRNSPSNATGSGYHAGIVVEVYEDGSFSTIEGNAGDAVAECFYSVGDQNGYIRDKYKEYNDGFAPFSFAYVQLSGDTDEVENPYFRSSNNTIIQAQKLLAEGDKSINLGLLEINTSKFAEKVMEQGGRVVTSSGGTNKLNAFY